MNLKKFLANDFIVMAQLIQMDCDGDRCVYGYWESNNSKTF